MEVMARVMKDNPAMMLREEFANSSSVPVGRQIKFSSQGPDRFAMGVPSPAARSAD